MHVSIFQSEKKEPRKRLQRKSRKKAAAENYAFISIKGFSTKEAQAFSLLQLQQHPLRTKVSSFLEFQSLVFQTFNFRIRLSEFHFNLQADSWPQLGIELVVMETVYSLKQNGDGLHSEVVITSTQEEIDEQWQLYDGFDPVLDKKLRARISRNVRCYGRFMRRMVSLTDGVYGLICKDKAVDFLLCMVTTLFVVIHPK
ncbi:hypothetical protein L2E82_45340 [Cichorium intybus]|uniref:Uncharacterized protein n=1 Tax=Cichorium intybus TaxID=13427 RepID=A0ACB8ZT10_CICIN|nr:hypothetical protein L2E82_45340 [Cichorium intybus]